MKKKRSKAPNLGDADPNRIEFTSDRLSLAIQLLSLLAGFLKREEHDESLNLFKGVLSETKKVKRSLSDDDLWLRYQIAYLELAKASHSITVPTFWEWSVACAPSLHYAAYLWLIKTFGALTKWLAGTGVNETKVIDEKEVLASMKDFATEIREWCDEVNAKSEGMGEALSLLAMESLQAQLIQHLPEAARVPQQGRPTSVNDEGMSHLIKTRTAPMSKTAAGRRLKPDLYNSKSMDAAARRYVERKMLHPEKFPWEPCGEEFVFCESKFPGPNVVETGRIRANSDGTGRSSLS